MDNNDTRKGYLALPFNNNKQLANFINSLLGTPQSITKRIKGSFEITLSDLQYFYDLVNQRITQQNKGRLLQFTTKIYYDDDSSVQLGSYEELISYNEVKPVVSEAVRMTWAYLIEFESKDVPEKQEIELTIISSPTRNIMEDDYAILRPFSMYDHGEFRISISHTERSWGSDIESLLTNSINSIIKPDSKWKKFIMKKSGLIGLLTFLIFLFTSLTGLYFTTKQFNQNQLTQVTEFISKPENNIDAKIDYISKYISSGAHNFFILKSILYIIILVIIAVSLGVLVSELADNKEKSFLILTKKAKDEKEKHDNKRKRKTLLFFLSIIATILINILSSYIFQYINI